MKTKRSLLIITVIGLVTLPQLLGDTPISCSDILRKGMSEGDGEYFVDPDGVGGSEGFWVYCDMANGGWQLIYNRNNAYFTPDHMVQRYPTEPLNFDVNSSAWFVPPDANEWRWRISVDGGASWRGITTAIPGEAFAETHATVTNVPLSEVHDNTLGSEEPFYFQTFTLADQCDFGCNSGTATWWGIVNVLQGAGDQSNPGIGGHSDSCDLDNAVLPGDNYTWGDDDLELYLSDYKDIQGVGIGGTNCVPDGPTDLYRYQFWARSSGIEVALDIKPGSCPNPLNVNSKGVLPVAVVGTADFDVTLIDPESVRLQGVPPLRFGLEDVATPFDGVAEGCGSCTSLGSDGFLDMTFKFDVNEVVAALGSIRNGNCVKVPLTGTLREEYGGTPVHGADSVKVIKGENKASLVFFDNFERNDFSERWVSGNGCDTNTIMNVGGRIQATTNCNFIETLESFSGNLRIEVDVEKEGTQDHGCWDFFVELAAIGATGSVRFDTEGVDGIGIGYFNCGDQYVMNASGPNAGHAVLTYADSNLHFVFENTDGEVLATDEVPVGASGPGPIRIWLAAHPGSPRYVDNVKIYELAGSP